MLELTDWKLPDNHKKATYQFQHLPGVWNCRVADEMLSDDTVIRCKEFWYSEGEREKTFREIKASTPNYGHHDDGFRFVNLSS